MSNNPTPHESAQNKASTSASKGYIFVPKDPEGEKKVRAPKATAADKKLNMDDAEIVEALGPDMDDAEMVMEQEANENWSLVDQVDKSSEEEVEAPVGGEKAMAKGKSMEDGAVQEGKSGVKK